MIISHSVNSGNKDDDDSDGQHTPPPLPSKIRLNSDTTADSKENIGSGLPSSSLTEAPSSMVLPSQLRDSTNLLFNRVSSPFSPSSTISKMYHI